MPPLRSLCDTHCAVLANTHQDQAHAAESLRVADVRDRRHIFKPVQDHHGTIGQVESGDWCQMHWAMGKVLCMCWGLDGWKGTRRRGMLTDETLDS